MNENDPPYLFDTIHKNYLEMDHRPKCRHENTKLQREIGNRCLTELALDSDSSNKIEKIIAIHQGKGKEVLPECRILVRPALAPTESPAPVSVSDGASEAGGSF